MDFDLYHYDPSGLTVVTPKRFAPVDITLFDSDFAEVKDGNGTWIVTDSLTSSKLRKRLAPFLGKKGEMTYRFGDKTLKFKFKSHGNTFEKI